MVLKEILIGIVDDKVAKTLYYIPYGFVQGMVAEMKEVPPWVTRDIINNP